MQKALKVLRDHQRIDEDPALVAPFAERQRLVRKDRLGCAGGPIRQRQAIAPLTVRMVRMV